MKFGAIICFLVMIGHIFSKVCEKGELLISSQCIKCQDIANTQEDSIIMSQKYNQCSCKLGFIWSSLKTQCLPIQLPNPHRKSLELREISNANQPILVTASQRLLQATTCNIVAGYMLFQQLSFTNSNPVVCFNCRLIPYGMTAADNSLCTCQLGYAYLSDWTTCYCYQYNYINPSSGKCMPCISLGNLVSQCNSCSSPYFTTSLTGCIYTPNLQNAVSNGACANGFVFDWYYSGCVCAIGSYAVNVNGVCSLCASSDYNCRNCVNSYFNDGHQCVHGSLISNYDYTTKYTCKTGYTTKTNPYNSQVVSCACSFAAQYFQNGSNCISCTSAFPAGTNLVNCQNCAASARFYKGSVECIYCPGVFLAIGTATVNGCDCPPNYFWNALTDKCQCDFALGFIGGAIATCIDCSKIANTDQLPLRNACSCLPGYKWNSQTNTCDCDTSSLLVFTVGNSCIDCATMTGSTRTIGADNASCVCIAGYRWDTTQKRCICDYNQNFAIFANGFCSDCKTAYLSNGLANAFGCLCINGFSWSLASKQCFCPNGNVVIGLKCVSCASATLPSGALPADCAACSNSKGFALQSLGCYSCGSQTGANTAVTNGVCTCSIAGTTWKPNLGACVCDWSKYYYTVISSSGSSYTCRLCSSATSNPSKCRCDVNYLLLDPFNKICTDASYDTHGSGYAITFTCKSGYKWNQINYPYQCISGYPAFLGYYSSSAKTYNICNSSSNSAMCSICNTASGYLYISGSNQCLLCSTVTGSTSAATRSSCLCNAGLNWNSISLTCDNITCSNGMIFNPSASACACDPAKSITVGSNCVLCTSIPQSTGSAVNSSACGCISSYSWVSSSSGGKCVSIASGTGTTNAITCNKTTQITLANGSCFTCPSSLNYGTGIINGTGCACINNFIWSTTNFNCICDLTKAYLAGTTCTACQTGTTGDGKGGCLCSGTKIWSGSSCVSCNYATNVVLLANGTCFSCGATGTYTTTKIISATNSSCACTSANLTWNPNGFCGCSSISIFSPSTLSCTCNLSKAYLFNSVCTACPSTSKGPNGLGGCLCNGTNIWNGNSCSSCNQASNQIILANNTCFVCGTVGTYTNTKIISTANNSCTCSPTSLAWNSNGYCDCGATSAMIISGNSFSCFNCANASAFTSSKANSTSCTCVSPNLKWNATRKACGCGDAVNKIIIGSGTSASCFVCTPSIYIIGVSADLTACVCFGMLAWNKATMTCGCANNSLVIVGNGSSTQCISCSSIRYGVTATNSTSCKCLGGLIFNSTNGGSCSCSASSIILPSFSCLACPSGLISMTAYECLCSLGSIWRTTSSSCVQCGSAAIPNSLASGGTNLACVCTSGYIWDVMTLSCISSTSCVIGTASCMKCPSGNATVLNAGSAKNLTGGAIVQSLLNGTFTNYNQLKGFQCPCSTGYSWDALRLRCFTTGLQ